MRSREYLVGNNDVVIDVMLPYYGDVDLMKKAVASVCAQHYQHWRLVVIDDGYPSPEPERYLNELASQDPRVHYLRNSENLGANANYRKALDLVEAPFFIMMGADDIMLPNYLDVVAEAFSQHPEVEVIQPGVSTINEHGIAITAMPDRIKKLCAPRHRSPVMELRGEDLAVSLLRANWTYFPSLAWRSSTVKSIGFRIDFDVVQDLALLLDIATQSQHKNLLVLDELAFLYRRHGGSDSMTKALTGERFDEERRFFRWQARRYKDLGWTRASRAASAHFTSRLNALNLMIQALKQRQFKPLIRLGQHVLT
ncbi:glycosyltransferase [Corynebacterium poyangense]|uniref:Glycosyltransferase n=1 Tax=Corynebacterium poyangense TaxID=2684405 RepID=A0A7H0SR77_9CORY|nr:glycosyltransferase [Corynebacterium poyangense]